MFVENREDGTADGAQISFTNNKKVNQISKALIDWLQILGKQNHLSENVIEDWDLNYIYLILCT